MRILQMEDSNKEVLFNACLDNKQKRSTTISELLDESNVKYKREEISLSRDHSTIYPIKLIKPNFIVDLMNTPGDLIPIGSPRSKLYCVKKITYNKTSCY